MKRAFGVVVILLMLSFTSLAGHPIRGGLLCDGDCIGGVCNVCGDCGGGYVLEAPPEFSWVDLIALIWLR